MKLAPVSVVIPTYNRRDIVRDAIDSALAQTLPPSQIIVVDDGSKDDTGAHLRTTYGDAIDYRRQVNAGLSAARNHGIRAATQPLIAFLDDDDVWHPRKLELQAQCFERNPELGLLGAEQFDWPAESFPDSPADPSTVLRTITWEQLVIRTLIPVSSVVVRRDVFPRAGEFDVTFRSSEDRDFFLRVARVARVGMLDAPLSGYRDTPGSMCKDPVGREAAMRRILREIDQRGEWRGRWVLRRKAYSFMHHVCSDANARAGNHAGSVMRTLKSLANYPLPYRRDEARMPFDRPRRLAVNTLRMLRLKSPDRIGAARPLPDTNALHNLPRRASEAANVIAPPGRGTGSLSAAH
jgi:glycosyltransferase involved in cell wall biosynthesis